MSLATDIFVPTVVGRSHVIHVYHFDCKLVHPSLSDSQPNLLRQLQSW